MAKTHSLGFPRVGRMRELKFALEDYWAGKAELKTLEDTAQKIRQYNWGVQKGLDFVPAGEFCYYDHMLDMSTRLGVIPERYVADESAVTTYFRMARGRAPGGKDVAAQEMTKWFNTNYHYLVPELKKDQKFTLNIADQLAQIRAAKAAGVNVKPVLVGPVTFLALAKQRDAGENSEARLAHLPALLQAYAQWLKALADEGIEWVQLDEPILVTDLTAAWQQALQQAYAELSKAPVKILLATYFGTLGKNLDTAVKLPMDGLHIDAVAGRAQLDDVQKLWPQDKVLSVGIVNGRNIWRTNLRQAVETLQPIAKVRGDKLWVAPSCSLLHSPVDLTSEESLDGEVKSWLAFAVQKVGEVAVIAKALNQGVDAVKAELDDSDAVVKSRQTSKRIHHDAVAKRIAAVTEADYKRKSPFSERIQKQQAQLKLPMFATTTIGSFPQTPEIRALRRDWRASKLSDADYTKAIQAEIKLVVDEQEALGLDVLVHGEPERNDMVEYFGELLEGFAFTRFGWVQSYGSRCVKPPIIFGDVYRPKAMTVEWTSYAQSLTKKPMKGMLTGPITILGWSFPRDDLAPSQICQQIALALSDEVLDLEKAGIKVIQIDEPAFRELLPLKKEDQPAYLKWAVESFRLSNSAVADETQIHTHMCYSEFNEIIEPIAALDADVITIETSRSDNELLEVFRKFKYPNDIGPGVYDIHSPRVPTVQDMEQLIERAVNYIPAKQVWVNPDCGLKTRRWEEVRPALKNMVEAAHHLRAKFKA
ncbi:5-methyltetrahydropteroyltriglutamate--homocysteine methyltransferase [Saezia sanguinis]|uniref:5-methyltetrahydropteroyltriglutamate--homocysteine methyltransferase n=1 Tax=Saezia sanguinis TaxID=1965230 RepID=A0A433SEX1_9BURK|nr:5-methyltetrahydropteroyltriglutamate--homocysteine S-methyltransferase [Saezia sanguinis]RUS67319.1 5-methyltetrahydropteroyltriglutamate--homocysteine methyltransferase [Saezia sanguinis]